MFYYASRIVRIAWRVIHIRDPVFLLLLPLLIVRELGFLLPQAIGYFYLSPACLSISHLQTKRKLQFVMLHTFNSSTKCCLMFLFVRVANSCILGDPHGDHVKIDGFTQRQVKGKEVLASNESSLALKLMDLFFTKEEMGKSQQKAEISCAKTSSLEYDVIIQPQLHVL